ncbi:IS30 family transposase [Dermacoccus abyssi]|uniref:IS30 family transposase n=1 Tax=Dermacoccus abyssi TaxID=322596 RepID=A0ABX5ZD41_9MICO|nr:IS30 family transposase [Dermacoccus abyssi]
MRCRTSRSTTPLYTSQIRAPRQGSLLRSGRSLRHARVAKPRQRRGVLRNMASIHDRPASVEDRAEVGHWEGDLIMGQRPSAVATLVERSTRLVRVVALPDGYKADAVRDALIENLADVPPQFRRSLTWDRGREMAFHDQVTHALGMQVFFCDARSPWQRGTNEKHEPVAASVPREERREAPWVSFRAYVVTRVLVWD